MMNYNTLIGSSLLDSYDSMINSTAQPQMMGGKRARKYVLPGSTDYDYPGSLSVGQGDRPNTVSGGSFSTDFARRRRIGAVRRAGERDYSDSESDEEDEEDDEMEGGKFSFSKSMKSVGKALKPVSRELKKTGKEALNEYVKQQMEGGKFSFGKSMKSVGKALKPVSRELKKTGKEVWREIIVPAGKEKLKEQLKPSQKSYADGGVLIRNDMSQFQSHSYPPSLASYQAIPTGKGRSRKVPMDKVIKCGGARSARGKIVSEVMKKHGLALGQASAFVKAHNLY